ncbi:unnamed protein product, partial [Effrenium voratum]
MPASPSPGPRGYFPPGLVKDSVPTLALEELVRPTAAELKIAAEGHGAKTGAKSLCEIEVKEVAFDMHDEKVQEDLADRLIAFLDEGEFLLLASALTTNGYPREPGDKESTEFWPGFKDARPPARIKVQNRPLDRTNPGANSAQNLSLEELLDLSASNNPKPKPNRMMPAVPQSGPPAPHAPAQAQGASGRGNAAEVDMAPKQAMHTQDPAATQRAAAQEANMTMQMMHAPDSAAAAQANMMQMQMMQMVADSAAAQANMVPTQMMHMQNSAAAAQANMVPTQMMQMQNSAAQANMMSTQMMQMQQSAASQANVAPTQMMQMNHSAVGAQANMQMMQMQQQVAAAQEANMAQMMQLQHSAAAQEMMQMQHSAAAQEANLAQMMQMQNSAAAQEMMHLQHAQEANMAQMMQMQHPQEANMAQMLQMQHSPATQEAWPGPLGRPSSPDSATKEVGQADLSRRKLAKRGHGCPFEVSLIRTNGAG